MRSSLIRVTLAGAAVALSLGLTGCSSDVAGSASVAPQEQRNEAAQELAAARQATLVPIGTQLELLERAEQRARLAGAPVAHLSAGIAGYRELAAAIEAAPTAAEVRALGAHVGAAPAPDAIG